MKGGPRTPRGEASASNAKPYVLFVHSPPTLVTSTCCEGFAEWHIRPTALDLLGSDPPSPAIPAPPHRPCPPLSRTHTLIIPTNSRPVSSPICFQLLKEQTRFLQNQERLLHRRLAEERREDLAEAAEIKRLNRQARQEEAKAQIKRREENVRIQRYLLTPQSEKPS